MDLVRDFTVDAKQKLLDAITRAEGQRGGFLGLKSLWDDMWDWTHNCDINDYNDIQDYYNAIADRHDITRAQLDTIFTLVYDAETCFVAKLNEQLAIVQALRKSFENMANIWDPSPVDGKGMTLARPGYEFAAALAGVTTELIQALLNSVVSYDEDGNPIYDWDEIDRILNKNSGAITELEYCILATLYANMNLEDSTRFLQALADKVEDIDDSNILGNHSPAEYTEWTYDSDKIENLQKYVNAMADVVAMQQWQVYNMTDAEIAALFKQLYPDQAGQNISIEDQREQIITDLAERRRALLQQSTFLDIVDDLANMPGANEAGESDYAPTSREYEGGNLTGPAGGFGPEISITPDGEGGYNFNYCNTQETVHESSYVIEGQEIYTQYTFYDHLHNNSVNVSGVMPGPDAIEQILQNMEGYFSIKYAAAGFNQVILSSIGDAILGAGLSVLFPVTGGTIAFLLSLGKGLAENMIDNNENAENLNDIDQSARAIRDANYCNYMALDAVVISDGTSGQRVIIYPTPDTLKIIDNINSYIQRHGISVSEYGLSYPIDLDTVMGKSNSVYNFLQSLNVSDREYVTDTRNWRA